jgi:hypothetical protein
LLSLAEQKSTAPVLDLTSATDAQIFGTSAAYGIAGGKNILWAGNVNFNTQSKYTGPGNDKGLPSGYSSWWCRINYYIDL